MPPDEKLHWERIYETRSENDFGWFQRYPETSIKFVHLFQLPFTANIIDIGGGDSHMVDALLDEGYQNIWVLDISAKAIDKARARLGDRASKVIWIISDIVEFVPPVKFHLWHDRAAFHFLTNEGKIHRYVSIAETAIRKGGYLILGTFSKEGPKNCSGLKIKQYSERSMSARFESSFKRVKCSHEVHVTPFNTTQDFLFCSFRKK